jgi:DNA topoisomerase I
LKLLIVESPAKSRTIEKFLGPGYKVAASFGHIRDLPGSAAEIPAKIKGHDWARLGIDVDNDYEPVYVVSKDSKKHVTALKKLLKDADELLLATDEDREGEAISWHLLEVLKPKVPVKRIAFHEITKKAITEALANPRKIKPEVVKAQESRRILDRLFGYTLSPVLWKKVRTKLSAGRVQSVAVRIIVELEELRQKYLVSEYWDVEANIGSDDTAFTAKLIRVNSDRLITGTDFNKTTGEPKNPANTLHMDKVLANQIAKGSLTNQPWSVSSVEKKETKKRTYPPFTTSTLQQAASSIIGMTPRRTMQTAQRLYEGMDIGGSREGLITYMRTDSLTLSESSLAEMGSHIKKIYGEDFYSGPRRYKTKAKSAQEAHEAIRPTSIPRTPDSLATYLDKDQLALYTLIWNRTVASQMTDAIMDRTAVELICTVDGKECVFKANGSIVKFPGFMKVLKGSRKDTFLPELQQGDDIGSARLPINSVEPIEHSTKPPARFTEASLIKKMESEGIGRPSTYASTLSTIQTRGYVVKKSGSLLPSYVGMAVVHLLRTHFNHYIEIGFTAGMEDYLDRIAAGEIDSRNFLEAFYKGDSENDGLLASIDKELPSIEYPAIPVGPDPETGELITLRIGRNYVFAARGEGDNEIRATIPVDLLIDEITPEKAHEILADRAKADEPIGICPETKLNVYVKLGPFGAYVQLGEVGEDKKIKPKRTGLPRGMQREEVTFEYALKLLSLPRALGQDPETGLKVSAGLGRFGPYVVRNKVYASLESPELMYTINLEEAVQLINDKHKKKILKELGNHPETGEPVQVLKGRWGPYVSDGETNANIGRKADLDEWDLDAALKKISETKKAKPKKKKKAKKKAVKKKTSRKKVVKKTAPKSGD